VFPQRQDIAVKTQQRAVRRLFTEGVLKFRSQKRVFSLRVRNGLAPDGVGEFPPSSFTHSLC
jgi:hypothetical protein